MNFIKEKKNNLFISAVFSGCASNLKLSVKEIGSLILSRGTAAVMK